MPEQVEIIYKPPDLLRRMQRYPQELDKRMQKGATQAILHVWKSVPPYPPPPEGSSYKRTGTLGRSLGSGMGGGAVGQPNIFDVKQIGTGNYVARFGTRLKYAPRVIGEGTQQPPWSAYWWSTRTILERAQKGIKRIFDAVAQSMADFIEGRGI